MTLTETASDRHSSGVKTHMPLVLASVSPRRSSLLARAGLRFSIVPPGVDETGVTGAHPEELARLLAEAKAQAVAAERAGDAVLAADTVVALGDEVLGKPVDAEDAVSMLRRLSGRLHTVYTGVAVAAGGVLHSAVERTEVQFRVLEPAEIDRYVQSGAALDKAGAYGIQDAEFSPVESYEGSYTNVVGLPLKTVGDLLRQAGVIDACAALAVASGEPK